VSHAAYVPHWEHFEHGADIGVRGVGGTLAQAFEQAAIAMTAAITDPAGVAALTEVEISCEAPDAELLLADWLNALVYEMQVRHLLFGRFAVSIHDNRLSGRAWGEPIDVARHHPAVEVKGATYTQLAVRKLDDGNWLAQCIVDV
jgi:tRNA nucleotidyltransferase (CCA-adding enzyme)